MKTLIVPDVHGSMPMLNSILSNFPDDQYKYIFLGDIFDRGNQVRDVFEKVLALKREGKAELIRGNHEEMTITAFSLGPQSNYYHMWYTNGGNLTLDSYLDKGMPMDYIKRDVTTYMIESMDYKVVDIQSGPLEGKSVMLSHAARPRFNASGEVVGEHHLWDRPGMVMFNHPFKKVEFSIHGHTPVTEAVFNEATNALYLDLGNFFSNKFAVMVLEDVQIYTFSTFDGVNYIESGVTSLLDIKSADS